MEPKSVKICQKLTSGDVTQAFKNINWVLIMIPEIGKPTTAVENEFSRISPKIQNFWPPRPTLRHFNLFPNDFLGHKAGTTSKLDVLTRTGRRGFAIGWLDPEHFRFSTPKKKLIVPALRWANLAA